MAKNEAKAKQNPEAELLTNMSKKSSFSMSMRLYDNCNESEIYHEKNRSHK